MPNIPALIESAAKGNVEDFRTLMLSMYDQFNLVNTATGLNWLTPGEVTAQAGTPPLAKLTVSGANGIYAAEITNPSNAASVTLWHEISYSPVKNFSQQVTTLEPTSATGVVVPSPGTQLYFRLRSSYDRSTWNSYQYASTSAVASGLQSSAATENNVVLNQSNYATVDSVAT